MRRRGQATLPATCGELVQGALAGVPCLVSCPIDLWARADVSLLDGAYWQTPDDAPKATQAMRCGLALLGQTRSAGALRLTSSIPRGRGYGSSTADICAALYALGDALDRPLTAPEIARLAVSIEPSDSTMFPGITLFDHRQGSFYEPLGDAPDVAVLVLDPGGEVDTIAFNQQDLCAGLRLLQSEHSDAFSTLRQALRDGDVAALGHAATVSARAHQSILHNPLLDQTLAIARDISAAGVCRAHSGTILGILLDPAHVDVADAAAYVRRQAGASVAVTQHRIVGGGPRS
jgi:L-threonine kinase